MKALLSLGLRYQDGHLWVLDQTRLPGVEEWLECRSALDMVEMIRKLQVRGAPLIGVAAALALALEAQRGLGVSELLQSARTLRQARPTAVNLAAAMDRMALAVRQPEALTPASLAGVAESIFEEDVAWCAAIGAHGETLLRDGDGVLTHCNAGGLATAGIGTALAVIRTAHERGKRLHVFVDETRPLLQGARLTAWELKQLGIPHTLICDNMAGALMREGRIQNIIVGADRIARNGDFANKTGTYSLAVLARHHGIPFLVAAPWTTVDPVCRDGSAIPIEHRDPEEVRGASGADCGVHNPAFDVTPQELVSAHILDSGVVWPADVAKGALLRPV